MKTLIKQVLFTVIILNLSFAQETKVDPGERETVFSTELPPGKIAPPQRKIPIEEQMLTEKLMKAKQSGNGAEMVRIQKQIDEYAGSVTQQVVNEGSAELLSGSVPSEQVITATKISGSQGVKSLAAVREQIGSSLRMWAVYVVSQFTGTDTVYTIYSDDNGNNWNYYTKTYITNTTIDPDEIDIELIQSSSNKYLYIVAGIRITPTGKSRIGLIVNKIGFDPTMSFSYLHWPGEDNTNLNVSKYRPRITSDCAKFQFSSAWIYIACCQDSVVSTGERTCVKVARINDPYSVLPVVTMKGAPYYFNDEMQYPDSFVDLAYYNKNDYDFIAVLQSNVPLNSNLYLTGSDIGSFTSTATYDGYMNGGQARQKRFGRISSNGYYTNLMITALETYSSEDLDIEYFKTTNSGANWTSGYIDYSGFSSWRAEIVERKNVPGEFYAAYITDLSGSSLKVNYSKSTSNNWGSPVQMNHLNPFVHNAAPCFTNAATDNCYVLWTETNGNNIWGSSGCSGNIVLNRTLQLNLFIQGRYDSNYDQMNGDIMQVQLRNNFSPYSIVGSASNFQGSNGVGSYNFAAAVNGVNYYIVVKHRNSIETWSKSPGQSFTANVLNYNFYNFAQAYGGNLVEVDISPYRFGIYTGDTNQDGYVDLSDLIAIHNAATTFTTGYVNPDLNGDLFVDVSDLSIAFNNTKLLVSVIRP